VVQCVRGSLWVREFSTTSWRRIHLISAQDWGEGVGVGVVVGDIGGLVEAASTHRDGVVVHVQVLQGGQGCEHGAVDGRDAT
jgi:hypothetical protein